MSQQEKPTEQTPEVEHTPECLEFQQKDAAWREKFPDYCTNCNGEGVFRSSFDPSPAGASLSSGSMEDVDLCTECSEKGLCPRCMQELPSDTGTCPSCGRTEEDGGRPWVECFCWEIEFNRQSAKDDATWNAFLANGGMDAADRQRYGY